MWFCCNRATGMVMCQRLLSWRRRASSKWNYSTFAKGQRGRWEDDWTWLKHQTLPQKDDARIAFSKQVCFFWFWHVLASFSNLLLVANGRLVRFKLWYSKKCGQIMSNCQNRCWFQIFLIFTPTWGKDPILSKIFQMGTTNYSNMFVKFLYYEHLLIDDMSEIPNYHQGWCLSNYL